MSSSRPDSDDEDIFDMIDSGKISQYLSTVNVKPHQKSDKLQTGKKDKHVKKVVDLSMFDSSSEDEVKTNKIISSKTVDKKKLKEKSSKHSERISKSDTVQEVKSNDTKSKKKTKLEVPEESAQKKDGKKKKLTKSEKKKLRNGAATAMDLKKKKHEKSEQQRQESFKEKQKAAQRQKNMIKNALANVDQAPANKKIVFASESEEEKEVEAKSKTKSSGPQLFDSDSGSDNEEEAFKIRPEYEGKKGQKLMKMQQKIKGNDDRFKLDQDFVETSSSDEEDDEPEKNTEQEKEQQRALSVLKGIVGEKAALSSKPTKIIKDMNALQYDPDREDTVHNAPKAKKLKKEQQKQAEEIPEVSQKRFYKVTGNLKEALSSSAGFSLLSAFGTTPDTKKEAADQPRSPQFSWQPPTERFSDESSSEDEQEEKHTDTVKETKSEEKKDDASSVQILLTADSALIKESTEAFCRKEDVDYEDWREKRAEYVESFRKKKKAARRIQIAGKFMPAKKKQRWQ